MDGWRTVAVKMPSDLYDTVEAATAVTRETMATFVRRAIEERLHKVDEVASSTESIIDGITKATETAFARAELRRRMLKRQHRWTEGLGK